MSENLLSMGDRYISTWQLLLIEEWGKTACLCWNVVSWISEVVSTCLGDWYFVSLLILLLRPFSLISVRYFLLCKGAPPAPHVTGGKKGSFRNTPWHAAIILLPYGVGIALMTECTYVLSCLRTVEQKTRGWIKILWDLWKVASILTHHPLFYSLVHVSS